MAGLLCIHAHPDDELYCAGLLAKLHCQGVPVHLLCVTRGEGGGLGNPPVATRDTLGKVREHEMRCSAAVLGATSLEFLNYVDPMGNGDPQAPRHDPGRFRREIIEAIARYHPEVVLTHGSNGEYGHPAHKLVHRIVWDGVVSLGDKAPLLYSFNAFHEAAGLYAELNADDRADLVLDVSLYYEQRVAAFRCHRSQLGAWVQLGPGESDRPASVEEYVRSVPKESFHRHWPVEHGPGADALQTWLEG